jgi:prevent-host-death family protein
MIRKVSATDVKNKFGEVVKTVYTSKEPVVVEKSGLPVVVIIPMSLYESILGSRKGVRHDDD